MSVPAVNSALDVANWFFKQAEREEIYLENEKVQHLLFLAQVHYALLNNKDYLSPSLFICDDNGFTEPNLAKTLSFGRPLMNRPDFPTQLNSFLTLIWKKYSPLSIRDLSSFIKNSPTYLDNYRMGAKKHCRRDIQFRPVQKPPDPGQIQPGRRRSPQKSSDFTKRSCRRIQMAAP